jgi:uncharacterized protein YraI
MNVRRLSALAAFIFATLFVVTLPAEAARAVAVANVTVRAGPGVQHRTVGRLRAGERVNVTRCASSRRWCHVQSRRTRDGWVSSRYLDRVRGGSNRPSGICFYGQRGQICLSR